MLFGPRWLAQASAQHYSIFALRDSVVRVDAPQPAVYVTTLKPAQARLKVRSHGEHMGTLAAQASIFFNGTGQRCFFQVGVPSVAVGSFVGAWVFASFRNFRRLVFWFDFALKLDFEAWRTWSFQCLDRIASRHAG